ncbi:ATP-dependent helicase [Nitrospinae bacterium AH_259_B05_G02_I21]|nr:ATP-dependent helicase [Nitrospinae bacterium AH_259_B05_G02_I21]MDA2931973.1 ATP-dependent helicase [Nitrospinae bacterium AH-259-F20]
MAWDEGLEGGAYRIAAINHSPLCVLAGPGTGKTFALIRRVARLLESGSSPKRLLVVTFTRTAAHDLVSQLEALNSPGCEEVRASTLHRFCFSALGRRQVLQITGRVPRMLLMFEVDFLLKDLPQHFGGKRHREQRLKAFESAWARLQTDDPGWPEDTIDQDFQRELFAWLQFHRAMLVGELVPATLSYLRNNPHCQERVAFDHVLVDEYQDLNRADQEIIKILAENGELTVVGDDDQSIYSLRFANPEGIIDFPKRHPGTHNEPLDECRRSPIIIVEMANVLISNNNRPDPNRRIQPHAAATPGEVFSVQWRTLEEEAEGLTKIIHHLIQEQDVHPGCILVLAPRRVIGYAIRDGLMAEGINAHSFFPEEALDSKSSQERFTLLTLHTDHADRAALRCWLGFNSPSLRMGAYSKLRQFCEQNDLDLWNVLEDLDSEKLKITRTSALVDRYRELKLELGKLQGLGLREIIDHLFPEDDSETKVIRELALDVEANCNDEKELREELRIRITQPELPTEGDFVRIMSLHKAKGLTADAVLVAGCVEGFVPYIDERLSSQEQHKMLEEHRRLFYVAITRTTHYLILSSFTEMEVASAYRMGAKIHNPRRGRGSTIATRFLQELGPTAHEPIKGDDLLRAFAV